MVSVVKTGFGTAAIDALGRVLDQRRRGDPLAPGLVVCGESLASVGIRRALGRRPDGIGGVRVLPIAQLVDELSGRRLAQTGQRQATALENQAAIRAELAETPGLFGRVADHPTTEERLVALSQELSGVDSETLERLEAKGTGLAGDAMRVLRQTRSRGASAQDLSHLLKLALDELDEAPLGTFGPIVLFLPEPARPFEGRLTAALARRADCDVIVGLTGNRDIDSRYRARLAAWSIQVDAGPLSADHVSGEATRATLLEVADPDDEVRAAIHDVAAHAALGVPLSRMAILYSTSDPYGSLLAGHLDAAGLPWCGPGRRSLITSLAGRFLLRLLQLAEHGLERASLVTFAATAPLVDEAGKPIDAGLWDRLSRQAGVVDGEQWEPRLRDLRPSLLSPDVEAVDGLIRFVAGLAEALALPRSSWREWGQWASQLLDRYLGEPADWPKEEVVARERVAQLLDQVSGLDGVAPPPECAGFTSMVAGQLRAAVVPGRPLGQGLLIAPVGATRGLDFERLVVIGLAEGIFPRSPREDSLLPDRLRAESKGLLAPTEARTDLDVRAVAVALAGARQAPLVVTARGDLRSVRSRSWPRVLNNLIASTAKLDSHYRNLADHGRPASREEFGLRSLIVHVEGGDPVNTHELAYSDSVLAANLARVLNRRRPEMNRHVGQVPAGLLDAGDRLLSATALEAYASCPRSYLFGRVLRLGDDERPERIDEITPADRGTLMHAILERFIADSLALGQVPDPGEAWGEEDRDRLFATMAEEVIAAQTRGVTGGRVNTRILERRLRIELELFLRTDNTLRAARRSTPIHVELAFGIDDEPSDVRLPDGRSVRLRGFVDRVDKTEDGGLLVIDYKGGSKSSFSGMEANPLDDGRRLQLPLYARVVSERLGLKGPRTALYWLTRYGELKPMELEGDLESDLDRTVTAALDGISHGIFPAVPGEAVGWPRMTFANCRYCDFDRICPTDRQREWEGVRHDPVLEPVEVLLNPTRSAS